MRYYSPGGGGGGSSLLTVEREFTEEELVNLAIQRNFRINNRIRSRQARYWYEILPRPGVGKFYAVHDIILERGVGVPAVTTSNFGPTGLFYSNYAENSNDNLLNNHAIPTGAALNSITIKLYLASVLLSADAYRYVETIEDFNLHEDVAVVFGMPSSANVPVGNITGSFKITVRYEIRDI